MGNTGLSQQRRQPANMSMFSLVSLFFFVNKQWPTPNTLAT